MDRIKLYKFFGAFSREKCLLHSSPMCFVCSHMSARLPRDVISVKFDIWDVRKNLPRNSKFRYNWTKI